MRKLFDFDQELVDRALHQDQDAFQRICMHLVEILDQVERRIAKLCPFWPTEHLERVRDLFVHDRFLQLFLNPPKEKIENFNALCGKFLWDSIRDAYRYFRAQMRDVQKEQAGDATGYGEDGFSTFWEAHAAEILASATPLDENAAVRAEMSDFMRQVNGHLGAMSKMKQKIIKMWMFGFTEREIAERLCLTIGNVGAIISRVISDLRKKLCKKDGLVCV